MQNAIMTPTMSQFRKNIK